MSDGDVPGRRDHQVQMVGAHVVPAEMGEQIAYGTLYTTHQNCFWCGRGEEENSRNDSTRERLTSPGIGYATGTMALYP
jgi:D-arabinose 1-dehydrogenase-like Zn-dependent alcohol dehydrogenase